MRTHSMFPLTGSENTFAKVFRWVPFTVLDDSNHQGLCNQKQRR